MRDNLKFISFLFVVVLEIFLAKKNLQFDYLVSCYFNLYLLVYNLSFFHIYLFGDDCNYLLASIKLQAIPRS